MQDRDTVAPRSSHSRHDSSPLSPSDHRKHRSRHRHSHDNSPTSDSHKHRSRLSPSHLIGLLLEAEQQSADLRRILATALARSQSETHRASDAERRAAEALQHADEARAAAATATEDARRAREDLAQCRIQLDDARRDAARELTGRRDADRRRMEAERAVQRARELVQRLEDERLVRAARAEGRRRGFEQGFVRGQRIALDDRPARGRSRKSRTLPPLTYNDNFEDDPTDVYHYKEPSIVFPDEEITPAQFLDDTRKFAGNVSVNVDVGPYEEHTSPLVVKSRFVENMSVSDRVPLSNPPSPDPHYLELEPGTEPQVDVDPPPISGTRTPPIQVYAISIPPQDELEGPSSPPPSLDHLPATSAPTGDSDTAPNGPRRRTRSGRFVHYLTAAKPRRWSSVKSNATTPSVGTTSSNPTAPPHEANTGLGLTDGAGFDPAEEAHKEREQDQPASLIPSSSEVREMLGGIIRPFRSLRRKKRDSGHATPVDEPGDTVLWHHVDAPEVCDLCFYLGTTF